MIDSVLFILCIIASILGGIMHYIAIRHFDSVHCPAALKEVRRTACSLPFLIVLCGALWLIGTHLDGVLPAFGPTVLIMFILATFFLGWHNLRYARQHQLPVVINQSRARQ